jgi:phosphoenolpyruvate carboxykinase (ATP)
VRHLLLLLLLLRRQCRMKVRVITSLATHALFATNMLITPSHQQLADYGEPDFVIYNAGACAANEVRRT